MFGDLLDDDSVYNKKYPLWRPALEVLGVHVLTGLTNRYVFDVPFARVGFKTWSHNLNSAWEWDTDRFGMNFLAHAVLAGDDDADRAEHVLTDIITGNQYHLLLEGVYCGNI